MCLRPCISLSWHCCAWGYVTPSPPLWPCRFKQVALWLHENACVRWRMGQKEQLKDTFDYQHHLGNCWRLLVQTVETVRCAISADELSNRSTLSLDSAHPALPDTHLVLFGLAVCKAGGLTACLYQPAKFCGIELVRVGFSSLVKGTKQKWRLARLHTWSSHCVPLSASVVLRLLSFPLVDLSLKSFRPQQNKSVQVQTFSTLILLRCKETQILQHSKVATVVFKF